MLVKWLAREGCGSVAQLCGCTPIRTSSALLLVSPVDPQAIQTERPSSVGFRESDDTPDRSLE